VVALRSGNFTFGAYLSHPLHLSGVWNGSPTCFIFSSTLGIKFSYHGRLSPRDAITDGESRQASGFYADLENFFVGNGDIIISGDLKTGVSRLESSYGIGLERESLEAKCMLAGSEKFIIDAVEFWSIQ